MKEKNYWKRNDKKILVTVLLCGFFYVLLNGSSYGLKNGNLINVYGNTVLEYEDTADDESFGDFKYRVLEDSTVSITSYFGTENEITIPSEINGMKVTAIDSLTFSDCLGELKINIPSGITNIEPMAFSSFAVIHIEVDNNNLIYSSANGDLYSKDKTTLLSAFSGQTGYMTIPAGVTTIGEYAFWGCPFLLGVDIPSTVTSIEMRAFTGCSGLTEIAIPSGVTSIGDQAFCLCEEIKEIIIPDSVTSMGKSVFASCTNLKRVTLPANLTSIPGATFMWCENLTEITLPSDLTSIGTRAFYGCTNLKKIIIPSSVTQIGEKAFRNCDKLTIYCEPNSCAETYAIENEIPYLYLNPVSVSKLKIKLSKTKYEYTGSEQKPLITVSYGNRVLKNNVDYKISYKNNIKIGTATVTITGKNNFTGAVMKTFNIVPGKVTSLKQSAQNYSSTGIQMSWNKVPGAAGYVVYRSTSKNGTYKLLKTVAANSFKNSYLKSGSKFYYKVRAYKTVNGKKVYGEYSDIKSMLTKPAMPTTQIKAGSRQAEISWSKSSGAKGYEIYMAADKNGTYIKVKTVNSLTTTYTKTGLTEGKKYYFKIKAYTLNGSGEKVYSGWSNMKSVTVK